ncbi:uncharacterized protein LOC103111356 [Erinaceus europaeus]|uniref:Uncharacterized protein LOC103111356 n=1 Tax=Erinaceus europaeus TaxID=9365 RepID=A0ABM3WGW4_ERIEU|nr:uncharacterized protein LOC103111356 [Erinaceus europaeus]
MAVQLLKEKRRSFVCMVSPGTLNGLLDKLLELRVLSQEEMEKVRDENATVMDKARVLSDYVIKKGRRPCQMFISHLCEEDPLLAETLGLSTDGQPGAHPGAQAAPAVASPLSVPQAMSAERSPLGTESSASSELGGQLKLCPLEMAQRIHREKSNQIYPIMPRSERKRLALIICNIEFEHLSKRTGADVDIRGMTALLEGLGYSVDVKKSLTASDMIGELKAFAARPEHKDSDSAFVVFMSHGIREGICGKNYSADIPDVLHVDTIFRSLNTQNCPGLKDKPKVIIIQACRGEGQGVTWVRDSVGAVGDSPSLGAEDFEDDAVKKAHVEKDFIAFCSSTPDNLSWRHPQWGSLFIMKLIQVLQEYAWSCDLEDMFRKVRLSFEQPGGRVQMPTTERVTLTRCFYLFPGHEGLQKQGRIPNVTGIFVFPTGDNKNPFKIVEVVGKEVLTGVLSKLVEQDVLKLKEEEKRNFNNANPRDKAWVLADTFKGKRREAGKRFIQTFFNFDTNSTSSEEGEGGVIYNGSLTVSSIFLVQDFYMSSITCPRHHSSTTLSFILNTLLSFKRSPWSAAGTSPHTVTAKNFSCEEPSPAFSVMLVISEQVTAARIVTYPTGDLEVAAGPPEPEESREALKLCPPEEFLRIRNQMAGEIYPIKEKKDRTRLALIICNMEFDNLSFRHGADQDIAGMKGLLEALDYKVDVEMQLTATEMVSVLEKFAARPEHASSDSTFLVFMSHGILEGIFGTKHSEENPDVLSYHTIFQTLNTRKCPLLMDKPKVVIVQACRGVNRGDVMVSAAPEVFADSASLSPDNLEDDASYKTHLEKDLIAFYASTPHNKSWRHETRGSLFITQLIRNFQKYAWCCDLEEIFRKVQRSFESPNQTAQIPTMERVSMTRYFYLFPGN